MPRPISGFFTAITELYAADLPVDLVTVAEVLRRKGHLNQVGGLAYVLDLNRSVEMRENKRPRLSDLRESGTLEQDADAVLLLYRDEYYNDPTDTNRGVAEVHVAKRRNGPTGTATLAFADRSASFESLAL